MDNARIKQLANKMAKIKDNGIYEAQESGGMIVGGRRKNGGIIVGGKKEKKPIDVNNVGYIRHKLKECEKNNEVNKHYLEDSAQFEEHLRNENEKLQQKYDELLETALALKELHSSSKNVQPHQAPYVGAVEEYQPIQPNINYEPNPMAFDPVKKEEPKPSFLKGLFNSALKLMTGGCETCGGEGCKKCGGALAIGSGTAEGAKKNPWLKFVKNYALANNGKLKKDFIQLASKAYHKHRALHKENKPIKQSEIIKIKKEMKKINNLATVPRKSERLAKKSGSGLAVGSGTKKGAKKNPWLKFLKKYRKEHPELSGKDVLIAAGEAYRN